MQQSGLSLLLFCVLFFVPSFHSLSTVPCASEINITWGERSFAHTLGFPRQAFLRDRSPELSETFVTLGFPICTFMCVYTSHYLCVHRDSLSRTTSGVCTSFFPGPHLRVSRTPPVLGLLEFCPTDTLCRETRQHALALTFIKGEIR